MEKEISQTAVSSEQEKRPKEVEQALRALQELEQMTAAVMRMAGLRPEHQQWLDKLQQHWQRCDRGPSAMLLVVGPMDELDGDGGSPNDVKRRRALASAVVEAALMEQPAQGPWDAQALRQTLLKWLALGAWHSGSEGPLTQIGRLIEKDSQTVRDALAVRLGILGSFWASLALWLNHSQ